MGSFSAGRMFDDAFYCKSTKLPVRRNISGDVYSHDLSVLQNTDLVNVNVQKTDAFSFVCVNLALMSHSSQEFHWEETKGLLMYPPVLCDIILVLTTEQNTDIIHFLSNTLCSEVRPGSVAEMRFLLIHHSFWKGILVVQLAKVISMFP